LNHSPAAASND